MSVDVQASPSHYSFDFSIGDIVYLKFGGVKAPGMVTGYVVRPGSVAYLVTWSDTSTEGSHYIIELSSEYEGDY